MIGQLIAEIVLDERARSLGLALTDAEVSKQIMSDPAFLGPNGQFDRFRFEATIRNAGYTEPRFVAEQRRRLLRRELAGTISTGMGAPKALVEAVNRYVNRRVRFTDDEQQFGRSDVWEAANETLRSGRGDCEDYAIAKLQMLRRAGLADRNLYLVIVKDLVRRADHAVLVVRAAGRMLVLDNGTDRAKGTGGSFNVNGTNYKAGGTFAGQRP